MGGHQFRPLDRRRSTLEPALDEIAGAEVEVLGADGGYLATAQAALHMSLTAIRLRSADGEWTSNLAGSVRCSSWVRALREPFGSGRGDLTFDFWADATRGEVCILLSNLLQRQGGVAGPAWASGAPR